MSARPLAAIITNISTSWYVGYVNAVRCNSSTPCLPPRDAGGEAPSPQTQIIMYFIERLSLSPQGTTDLYIIRSVFYWELTGLTCRHLDVSDSVLYLCPPTARTSSLYEATLSVNQQVVMRTMYSPMMQSFYSMFIICLHDIIRYILVRRLHCPRIRQLFAVR